MTRIETIGDATLYLGDSSEIMPALAPVDVVITDPPYSANTHEMSKSNKGAGHGVRHITFEALTNEDFIATVRRTLDHAAAWVVMTCDYKHAALLYEWPEFVRLGVWVKPNPMPQISADRPGQGFEAVAILHGGKRAKVWNRGGGAGVWTMPVVSGGEVPTQKPLALAAAFVADFTLPRETVLDPFMGSGTTGVACLKAGRKFIGIEADAGRFDIACKRLSEAWRQPRLFDEAPAVKVEQTTLGFER